MKFTGELLRVKLKATAIHFSISAVIFIILAYLIYFVWYPQPYFSIDGGWQGIRIVAAVDLVLGPMITFLIFDLSKKRREIISDLCIIAVIQLSALVYGVHTTYQQRPAAIVLFDDFLVPVLASDYQSQIQSVNELQRFSDEKPPIIFSDVPLKREVIEEMKRLREEDGIIEFAQMQFYQPEEKLKDGLKSRQAQYRSKLEQGAGVDNLNDWLEKNDKQTDEVLVALFNGRYGRIWLVFDLDGKYIGYFQE